MSEFKFKTGEVVHLLPSLVMTKKRCQIFDKAQGATENHYSLCYWDNGLHFIRSVPESKIHYGSL